MKTSKRVAYVFNRTCLGIGVLLGIYFLWVDDWLKAIYVCFVLVPLYFWLHDRFDAP